MTKNNFSQREKEKDYGYEQLTLLISNFFKFRGYEIGDAS